jgi:hypothetical protein
MRGSSSLRNAQPVPRPYSTQGFHVQNIDKVVLAAADLRLVREKGLQRLLVELVKVRDLQQISESALRACRQYERLSWYKTIDTPCFSWRALDSCKQLQTSSAMQRAARSCRILNISVTLLQNKLRSFCKRCPG